MIVNNETNDSPMDCNKRLSLFNMKGEINFSFDFIEKDNFKKNNLLLVNYSDKYYGNMCQIDPQKYDKIMIQVIQRIKEIENIDIIYVFPRYSNFSDFIKEYNSSIYHERKEKYLQFIESKNYNLDLYQYLSENKKRFKNGIYYSRFIYDRLSNIDPLDILKKGDNDELWRIYRKFYLQNEKNKKNIKDFILWLHKNRYYLLEIFLKKIYRLYGNMEIFDNYYYVFSDCELMDNNCSKEKIKQQNIDKRLLKPLFSRIS